MGLPANLETLVQAIAADLEAEIPDAKRVTRGVGLSRRDLRSLIDECGVAVSHLGDGLATISQEACCPFS